MRNFFNITKYWGDILRVKMSVKRLFFRAALVANCLCLLWYACMQSLHFNYVNTQVHLPNADA